MAIPLGAVALVIPLLAMFPILIGAVCFVPAALDIIGGAVELLGDGSTEAPPGPPPWQP